MQQIRSVHADKMKSLLSLTALLDSRLEQVTKSDRSASLQAAGVSSPSSLAAKQTRKVCQKLHQGNIDSTQRKQVARSLVNDFDPIVVSPLHIITCIVECPRRFDLVLVRCANMCDCGPVLPTFYFGIHATP